MKIISLNIWGGQVGDSLLDFFHRYSDTDIFLLQEVFHQGTHITAWSEKDRTEIFSEIIDTLPDHVGYFAPAEADEWGLAVFIKKDIDIEEMGDIFVHREKNSLVGKDGATSGKNLQYIKIKHKEQDLTVLNFHGLWNGQGKTDTEDRINQSKRIVNFIKQISHNVVLAGDFNLRPDTESLQMIEKELNLKNLIAEYGVSSTRTSFYTKEEKFADYVFVSPDLEVKDFKVLPDEVSDHAALFVEI